MEVPVTLPTPLMLRDGAGLPDTDQTSEAELPLGIEDGDAKKEAIEGGATFETVTVTAVAVAGLPEVSVAVAVRLRLPAVAVVVFQETAYGGAVTAGPRLPPSSLN